MTIRRSVWLVACVLLLCLGAWHWLPGRANEHAGSPDVLSSVAAADEAEIHGIGYLEPLSELRQLVPRTSGVIRRCVATVGQSVHAGDVILELDDSTQQADLEVARQELAVAKTQAADVRVGVNPFRLKTAEQTLARMDAARKYFADELARQEKLVAQRAVTPEGLAKIRHDAQQAELQWLEQSAELEHLRHWTTPEQLAVADACVQLAAATVAKAIVQGFNLHGRSFSGRVTEIKPVMGAKTVFSRSASERKDLTVMEVLIDLDESPPAPVGLQVDVRIIE